MINKDKLFELYEKGFNQSKLAILFGVSRSRISQILLGYRCLNKQVREVILRRDNYECQWKEKCFGIIIPKEQLQVHHISCETSDNGLDNLITLCVGCHNYFHSLKKQDEKNGPYIGSYTTYKINNSKK